MNTYEAIKEALLEHALSDFNNFDPAEYDGDYSIGDHLLEAVDAVLPPAESLTLDWCIDVLRSAPDLLETDTFQEDATLAHAIRGAIKSKALDDIRDAVYQRATELGFIQPDGDPLAAHSGP